MKAGTWNLIFGLVAVAAGASGQLVLLGTSSSTALVVVGALLATVGLIQLIRARLR